MNTIVQNEITALAERIGEDSTTIIGRDAEWAQYLQSGVVVALHMGRWRATVKLSLEDVGVYTEDPKVERAIQRTLNPGTRYLLPLDYINRGANLEAQARYRLEKLGRRTYWGTWIYEGQYRQWREETLAIQAKYLALSEEIYNDWEKIVEQVTLDYLDVANGAYDRLLRDGAIIIDSRDQWIANYLQRVISQIPTRERARDKRSFYWDVRYLPLQASLAQDKANAEYVYEVSRQRAQIEASAAFSEDLRLTAAADAALGIKRFADDLKVDIRERVYDVVVSALETLKKRGALDRNTTIGLRNLIETCSTTVFWSDPDLENRLQSLDAVISVPSAKRDPEDVRDALQRLGAESRIVLLNLDREPERSARNVGIPDADLTLLDRLSRRGEGRRQELLPLDMGLTGRQSRGGGKRAAI